MLTDTELAWYHARAAALAPPDMLAWLHREAAAHRAEQPPSPAP
jgi:hypothetical protein